jgi:tetratricopeptide (TPR) repeat protein
MRNPPRLPLLIIVVLGGLLPAGSSTQLRPPRPGTQSADNSPWLLPMVVEWRTAVAQHDAGMRDQAVEEIGAWAIPVVRRVIGEVKKLAELLVASRAEARVLGIQHLLGLTDDEMQRGDANRILKRGALLHTDIAILAPAAAREIQGGAAQLLIKDGLLIGENAGPHWEFARLLLDAVKPSPARDEMVRQWYLAAAADMQHRRQWGNAEDHLSRARRIFRSDASFLFYSGAVHEFYAGPSAQNSALVAPPGSNMDFGSRDSELGRSRGFYREAVVADPDFAEARLRLGRVTGLILDHSQAVAELQKAAAVLVDPQLRYYAALFLGQEQVTLGHYDAAQEQFQAATVLYPTAQSPRLALNHLLRWSVHFPETFAETAQILMLPSRSLERMDPWWVYDISQARNADELVAEMRRAIGGLPR